MRQVGNEPETGKAGFSHEELTRQVNLRIFNLASRYTTGDDVYAFACECGDPECREWIRLHLHRFDPTMPAGSLLAHVPREQEEHLG